MYGKDHLIKNEFLKGDFECKPELSFFQNFSALLKLFFFLPERKWDVLYICIDVEINGIHLHSVNWHWLLEKKARPSK